MTNFEKALEAAAQKEFDRWCAEKFSGTPKNWPLKEDIAEHFINWSRKFTIDEVCEYLKNIGCVCNRAWNEDCVCEDYESVVIAIEQHFKDRGTK